MLIQRGVWVKRTVESSGTAVSSEHTARGDGCIRSSGNTSEALCLLQPRARWHICILGTMQVIIRSSARHNIWRDWRALWCQVQHCSCCYRAWASLSQSWAPVCASFVQTTIRVRNFLAWSWFCVSKVYHKWQTSFRWRWSLVSGQTHPWELVISTWWLRILSLATY